jgi:tetratricopeptide (TPR) repeat protein
VKSLFRATAKTSQTCNAFPQRDSREPWEGKLVFRKGPFDFKGGKYDAAIERFSKLEPNPWTMFYQAQANLKKGNKEAAKALFEKVVAWNQNILDLAVVWTRTHKALGK